MTRDEANARLAELQTQVQPLLQEMHNLAVEHNLTATMSLDKAGYYQQHFKITGAYSPHETFDTWTSSDYSYDSWNSSDC